MIYVAENGDNGHLKIGYAVDPERRLVALQIGNSSPLRFVRVFPGDRALERKIHRDLSRHRLRGEWFQPAPELWRYLESCGVVEYEEHDGRRYLVLRRDHPDADTDVCPFCGRRHQHGSEDGHRVAHCSGESRQVRSPDGTVLCAAHGYMVRSRTNSPPPPVPG